MECHEAQKSDATDASMLINERKKLPWPSIDSLQKSFALSCFDAGQKLIYNDRIEMISKGVVGEERHANWRANKRAFS
jgi:hypothetical protein